MSRQPKLLNATRIERELCYHGKGPAHFGIEFLLTFHVFSEPLQYFLFLPPPNMIADNLPFGTSSQTARLPKWFPNSYLFNKKR